MPQTNLSRILVCASSTFHTPRSLCIMMLLAFMCAVGTFVHSNLNGPPHSTIRTTRQDTPSSHHWLEEQHEENSTEEALTRSGLPDHIGAIADGTSFNTLHQQRIPLDGMASQRRKRVVPSTMPTMSNAPPRAASASLTTGSLANKTALLVRGHWLTRSMLDKITSWALDCAESDARNANGAAIDVILSLDTTSVGHEAARSASNFFRLHHVDSLVHIHTYNTTDMLTAYPTLKEALNAARGDGTTGMTSAAYGFHTEAIMLWYAQLGQTREKYKHVWVFEADVAYTGDHISALLRKYSDRADFITEECRPVPAHWDHIKSCTASYRAHVASIRRLMSVEAVQRFSRAMLHELRDRLDEGMHAWSEEASCTLAKTRGLRVEYLDRNDLGVPFSWEAMKAVQPVTEFNFNRYKRIDERKNKLYHPVKY